VAETPRTDDDREAPRRSLPVVVALRGR